MPHDSFFSLKDGFYLVLGLVLGFLLGIAAYWLPLGQFLNECRALWHLSRKRFNQGNVIRVKAGTDLYMAYTSSYPLHFTQDKDMTVWRDAGVEWYHLPNGWARARVLHVFDHLSQQPPAPPIYKVCHYEMI